MNEQDQRRVRDVLLVVLVGILLWYLFKAERKHAKNSLIFGGTADGTGSRQISTVTNSCGGNGATVPEYSTGDYHEQQISPGSPPVSGGRGYFYANVSGSGGPVGYVGGGAPVSLEPDFGVGV